jgi:hypothetical protein
MEQGAEPAVVEVGPSGPRSGRRAALAVVAIVVAVAVVGSTGVNDDSDTEAASPTAAERPTPTVPRIPGRLGEDPLTTRPPAPPFGTPLPGRMVLIGAEHSRVVDLTTGVIDEVAGLAAPDRDMPVRAVPTAGGVVVVEPNGGGGRVVFHPLGGAAPVVLGRGFDVFASDHEGRMWIVDNDLSGRVQVAEVDLARTVVTPRRVVPSAADVVGAVEGGVVLQSVDGVFVMGRDGTLRRVAAGRVIGTAGLTVLHVACDEQLTCRPWVTDVGTGQSRVVSGDAADVATDPSASLVLPSPSGRALAMCACRGEGIDRVVVVSTTSGVARTVGAVPDVGTVTWSPDGEWLMWQQGRDLVARSLVAGSSRRAALNVVYDSIVAV